MVTMVENALLDLVATIDRLKAENDQLLSELVERTDMLSQHQANSSAMRTELRVLRAESRLPVEEREFLMHAAHMLTLARKKYPTTEPLPHLLAVLSEETGEAARALTHNEGPERLRDELAQVVATCVRIAVERLHECPSKGPGWIHSL